jgi:hypothetical protein
MAGGYGTVGQPAKIETAQEGPAIGGITEISTRYFFTKRALEVVMSEKRVQEPDSMDQLMELQSRLRELTEAKKAKWRELGRPLPDSVSPEPSDPTHPDAADTGQNGTGMAASPPVADAVSTPSVVAGEKAGEMAGETAGDTAGSMAGGKAETAFDAAPGPTDKRFARRRDATAEWGREARMKAGEARQWAAAFWRQAVGQVRDLTGGLGARHRKPKPRPGDPVTAEELIDDRSLGARLLGAAVFFVGLVAIGAVALVQLGKLEIPWLEDNALPAATATAGSGIDAAGGASLTEESSGEQNADDALEAEPEVGGSETESVTDVGPAASEGSSGALESEPASVIAGSESGSSETSEAVAREVLEFTRLQGELAFLIGEYDIVRNSFESGEAGCEELNTRYASVDSAHLLMSRVVARWRQVPYRQVKAYEEISGMVDGTLRHYAASGCGLDPSELPGGE